MTRIAYLLSVLATILACSMFTSSPAHARARVFVASYGNDANPCTFTQPCRNFQQAVNVVDPGGEVSAIDSAGFGSINITRAVTITSPEGVEAGIVTVAGGDGVDINAGPSDAVVLRGLTLNGGGVGFNGVVFNSGGSLTVTNCVVQNFHSSGSGETTGNGILLQPTTGTVDFVITNTIVANNPTTGIIYSPPSGSPAATIVIEHVTATGNSFIGITVNLLHAAGGSAVAAISNSTVSNGGNGIDLDNNTLPLTASIDNVNVVGNTANGIAAFGTSKVLLGRSVVTGNSIGIQNQTSPNTFFTYKDNRINENTTDICSIAGCLPLNTTLALQ